MFLTLIFKLIKEEGMITCIKVMKGVLSFYQIGLVLPLEADPHPNMYLFFICGHAGECFKP